MNVNMIQVAGDEKREVVLYPRDMAKKPHRLQLAAEHFGPGRPGGTQGSIIFTGDREQYRRFLEAVGDRETEPVTV